MYSVNDIVLFKHRSDTCKWGKIVSVCGQGTCIYVIESSQETMNVVVDKDVIAKS